MRSSTGSRRARCRATGRPRSCGWVSSTGPRAASRNDTTMAGFYIQHNTTIGLQCFAYGLFFGIGSLYQLASNATILGTVFGYMATSPSARNFFTFVTAHAPFELTAIVLAGAAG